MSDKNLRNKASFDYKIYSETGEKVSRSDDQFGSNPSNNTTSAESDVVSLQNLLDSWSLNDDMAEKQIQIEESILSDEIGDFIDENVIADISNTDELNSKLSKMEELRSKFRRIHKEMNLNDDNYDQKYGKEYAVKMNDIKIYIKEINNKKKSLSMINDETKRKDAERKNKVMIFQMEDLNQQMEELEQVYEGDLQKEDDKRLKVRRNESKSYFKDTRKIGEKIFEMMNSKTDNLHLLHLLGELKTRYEDILNLKEKYQSNLRLVMEEREIDKNESFQLSSLNIKLQKFQGYQSAVDVYTFKSTFEKIHLKSTPKSLLPDLLKNNYLEGAALTLVYSLDDIDEIWDRLKAAFGNCKIMLSEKLTKFTGMEGLWKHKSPSKLAEELSKLVNCMRDVIKLAKDHNIQNTLYYGDSIEKIYKLCGEERINRWFNIQCDSMYEGEELWQKLIDFLEKDIKINQQKTFHGINQEKKPSTVSGGNRHYLSKEEFQAECENDVIETGTINYCSICGNSDHVATNGPNSTKIVQYFACQKFVQWSPSERFAELKSRGLCCQCLYPGAKHRLQKHKEGRCQSEFACKHPSHDKYTTKLHVLLCQEHRDSPQNQDLLQEYKEKCILRQSVELPSFSKDIHLSFHTSTHKGKEVINQSTTQDDQQYNEESGIYMLQTIKIDNECYTIFYDSGCSDFVTTYNAAKRMGERAQKQFDGPISVGGVGGASTKSPHGIYSIKLPLANGKESIMTGICLERITTKFPYYPIAGKIEDDIKKNFASSGGDCISLPKLPEKVGGEVDFMVGIKYLRYFPNLVFQLPSGLSIYKSHFKNADGSDGVIGGPHHVFTEIEKYHHLHEKSQNNFVKNQQQIQEISKLADSGNDMLGLDFNDCHFDVFDEKLETCKDFGQIMLTKELKLFEKIEDTGICVPYRCVNCRECKSCKSQENEWMRIKEEVEQDLIEKSVVVDTEKGLTIANLPFIKDPAWKL